MYIIGLHNDIDSGVCLLKNGELLEAVGEERLQRIKLYQGLPERSLAYVLDKYHLGIEEIDYFAYGWNQPDNNCRIHAEKLTGRLVTALERNPDCGRIIQDRVRLENDRDQKTLSAYQDWLDELGIPPQKRLSVDHHESHAWSAFAASPFERAVIFTFDGRGDLKSASVSSGSVEHGIEQLDYLLTYDSLGYLYSQITQFLGYKPHRHEGKITGLAAHGDPDRTLSIFKEMFSFEDGSIVSNLGAFNPFFTVSGSVGSRLEKYSREDIAAGLQKHCEDLIQAFIGHWMNKIGRPEFRNVCLAGGLFANVRINQLVNELDEVDNIFVFPNMGDGGIAAGSAFWANHHLTGRAKIDMPTVYLGPEYSNGDILTVLEENKARVGYERLEDKVSAAAKELEKERVVGYFDGRMEYGPRALGSRSILYHTRDASVNDWLNRRLTRTEFMPFAPVTPAEYAPDCYVGWTDDHISAHFMTRTYNCTDEFKQTHPAVVHVDGTARPQVVTEEMNGDYYRIVKEYCQRTGERSLVNTSFNRHEEPIVCSPGDAVGGLIQGLIDVLFIGDYKATKK